MTEIVNSQKLVSRDGYEYEILRKYETNQYLIRFCESGNIQVVSNAVSNRRIIVVDHSRTKLYGIGVVIGTIDNPFSYQMEGYSIWAAMLYRCYGKINNINRPFVCNDWHTFGNFQCWYLEQLNWYKNQSYKGEKLCLDKDLLSNSTTKTYSPETCCIIPADLNVTLKRIAWVNGCPSGLNERKIKGLQRMYAKYANILQPIALSRLERLLSISMPKTQLKFKCRIWSEGKSISFDTIEDAIGFMSQLKEKYEK